MKELGNTWRTQRRKSTACMKQSEIEISKRVNDNVKNEKLFKSRNTADSIASRLYQGIEEMRKTESKVKTTLHSDNRKKKLIMAEISKSYGIQSRDEG